MLEVSVHHDHCIPAREIDSGRDRELVSEVPCELDYLEAWVTPVRLEHEWVADVGAAVVDQQHFGVAVEQREDVCEAALELLERLLLVVDRDDDRIGRHRVHVNAPGPSRAARR